MPYAVASTPPAAGQIPRPVVTFRDLAVTPKQGQIYPGRGVSPWISGTVNPPAPAPATWTQIVNHAGTSMTGITPISGTWDIGPNGYLRVAKTAAWHTARFFQGAKIAQAVEVEVRLVSAVTASNYRLASIVIQADSTPNDGTSVRFGYDAPTNVWKTNLERHQVSDTYVTNLSPQLTTGTWYRFRVITWGRTYIEWFVDNQSYAFGAQPSTDTIKDSLYLAGYDCEVEFRNIKAWESTNTIADGLYPW